MNAFIHHFNFEFRTGIRNKQLLLMIYLFPLGFYLMTGAIMAPLTPFFKENMIPAMAVFAIMSATLMGIPEPLVKAREKGIFRSYKINGIPSISILAISGLTTILHLTIVVTLITVIAPIFFGAPLPTNWLYFVLVFVAMAFACTGLSILIGAVSPSRLILFWTQIIFLPSTMLGGLMLPFRALPETGKKIAQLLPATQAMDAFNGLAMGKTAEFSPLGSICILLIGGVLAFGLAVYLFNWDNYNATRRGSPYLAFLVLAPYAIAIFLRS
jgi:ABC-2 type transport system permease protein